MKLFYRTKQYRFYILLSLVFLVVISLLCIGPIPQDQNYHRFADRRILLGIANFWDVASNIPMLIIGAFGIKMCLKNWNRRPGFVARWLPLILCLGMVSACFGSAYYHLAPDNASLVWDRLPMVMIFMPVFALLIYDFMGKKMGEISFYVLIPMGIASVLYWDYTESLGRGDLRLYAFVQFFPMVAAPFIIWLYYKKVIYLKYIVYLLVSYAAAKFAEHFDYEIFDFTGFWSGHTIKHLLAAVSLFFVVKLIVEWEKQFMVGQSDEP